MQVFWLPTFFFKATIYLPIFDGCYASGLDDEIARRLARNFDGLFPEQDLLKARTTQTSRLSKSQMNRQI